MFEEAAAQAQHAKRCKKLLIAAALSQPDGVLRIKLRDFESLGDDPLHSITYDNEKREWIVKAL